MSSISFVEFITLVATVIILKDPLEAAIIGSSLTHSINKKKETILRNHTHNLNRIKICLFSISSGYELAIEQNLTNRSIYILTTIIVVYI